MTEAGPGNGAEVKTAGGWVLRLGGPMAMLGAAFGLMVYLGWLDRQDIVRRTDKRYEDVREQILTELHNQRQELRLLRCAVKMGAVELLMNNQRIQTDEDWTRYCRWLDHHPTPQGPVPEGAKR